MNDLFMVYSGALQAFSEFGQSNNNIEFEYEFTDEHYIELLEKYPVAKAAGNGDDFSKAINLLEWVYDKVWHDSKKNLEFIPKDAVSILDYSYGKGAKHGVYCRLHAIVLTECCLALGIKARTVHGLPFNPYDFESHVFTMAYIESLEKWVLLDPANAGYFMNSDKVPLSPLEVRSVLAGRGKIYCNKGLKNRAYYQGFDEKTAEYKTYMAKNLFYLKCFRINTFGTDNIKDQKTLYLAPAGFDVRKREITCSEYAANSLLGEPAKQWHTELERIIDDDFIRISDENFLRI